MTRPEGVPATIRETQEDAAGVVGRLEVQGGPHLDLTYAVAFAADRSGEDVRLLVLQERPPRPVGNGLASRSEPSWCLFRLGTVQAAELAGRMIAAARDAGLGMDAHRIARDAYKGER